MKIQMTLHFPKSLPRSEKRAILRAAKRAKTLDELAEYTRERGYWLICNTHHKMAIVWK